MGFPGHFRIPGHSGTDQKNKKAFSKWRKWQREDALTYESERSTSQRTGKYEQEYALSRKGRKWMLLIGVPIIILALTGGSWLFYEAGDRVMSSLEVPTTISLTPQTDTERLRTYHHYRRLGNQALGEGDYETAWVNFTEALAVAPYSENARTGLVKVLEHFCAKDQKFCEAAVEQRDFMNNMGWGQPVR